MFWSIFFLTFLICGYGDEGKLICHQDCKEYSKYGINIKNVSSGSKEFEVWRSSIGAFAKTPKHKHESEEVFVFYKGKGKALIGDQEVFFEAPCTLVLPANIEHQIINTEDIPTDHIAIIKVQSKIYDATNKEMHLPWRSKD